ncbi:MAG: hypothetical protein LBQ52_04555 [Helicobacteraceae bacterium]|jgi:hypothetical protein|nr:hypothetical protein [Helicobacteraceae bacterium]
MKRLKYGETRFNSDLTIVGTHLARAVKKLEKINIPQRDLSGGKIDVLEVRKHTRLAYSFATKLAPLPLLSEVIYAAAETATK